MHSPYGLDVSDSCVDCTIRSDSHFCDFDAGLLKSFEARRPVINRTLCHTVGEVGGRTRFWD